MPAGGAAEPFPLSRAFPNTRQPVPPDTTPARIPGRRCGTSELHQVNQALPTNRRGPRRTEQEVGLCPPRPAPVGHRPPFALASLAPPWLTIHTTSFQNPPRPRPRHPAPPGKTSPVFRRQPPQPVRITKYPPTAPPAPPRTKSCPRSGPVHGPSRARTPCRPSPPAYGPGYTQIL